ncbi:uncharacterized protein LOC113548350 [Rhopalosiphum maidis]|uniref:uncharacterized protein LOC113548350 n=1 Tax=Rhopalosiphum maidis TaxID=43146 RepID=UPI000F002421|nr:uncharacterized protein LOC113548350 [Rhopalosiphum maidis]
MKDQITSSSIMNPVEVFTKNASQIETATKARMPTEDTVKCMLRRKLDSLAFLPEKKVLEGMDFLRTIMPPEATGLVNYFDTTYVHGSYRSVQHNPNNGIRLRNIAPFYPPSIWNVYQTILDNGHRTNNETEGWNHCFPKLAGHNHSSIWTLIKKMRLELSSDETKLAQFAIGNLNK